MGGYNYDNYTASRQSSRNFYDPEGKKASTATTKAERDQEVIRKIAYHVKDQKSAEEADCRYIFEDNGRSVYVIKDLLPPVEGQELTEWDKTREAKAICRSFINFCRRYKLSEDVILETWSRVQARAEELLIRFHVRVGLKGEAFVDDRYPEIEDSRENK